MIKMLLLLIISVLGYNQSFSQQILNLRSIFTVDYAAFRIQPEKKLQPHLQVFEPSGLSLSTNLTSKTFEQLISDSSFLIDTMYFSGIDNQVKQLRRTFEYDSIFRIKSVKTEVQIEKELFPLQITSIVYNEKGNVDRIDYNCYQEERDSLIIRYLYNKNGLLLEENAQNKNRTDTLLTREWNNIYSYDSNNNLATYILSYDKRYFNESGFVKYDINNKPIECIEYITDSPAIEIDSLKRILEYSNELLTSSYFFAFENSDTSSVRSEIYQYNEFGNISKELIIDKDEYSKYPSRMEYSYYYNDLENIDSVCITSSLILNQSSDSLIANSSWIFNYNFEGYLVDYTIWGNYKNEISGRRVIYTRDEFNNVIFAQEETWSQDNWNLEKSMRIVYKQKDEY